MIRNIMRPAKNKKVSLVTKLLKIITFYLPKRKLANEAVPTLLAIKVNKLAELKLPVCMNSVRHATPEASKPIIIDCS